MATITRRTFTAAFGATLLAGPVVAQGQRVAPAGFTGQVFVNEGGGVRIHTYLADAKGALVTSHIIEGPAGLVLIDGQFQPHAAIELRRYLESIGKPISELIVSHAHPDHWFGIHHIRKMPVLAGPITGEFLRKNGAKLVEERKADSSAPDVAGTLDEGSRTIAGVELRFRHVLNTEAPEITIVEVPAVGAVIVQDILYNKVHAVVSRQLDNWIAVLKETEGRGSRTPIILAGHGEPASPVALGELVRYLEAVKPLLNANIGQPDKAKAIVDEIAKTFPEYRLPGLLALGLSRALQA